MILTADNIGRQKQGRWLYRKLSFSCQQGEALIISGLSGSGKTTLLNTLAQLETNDEGHLSYSSNKIGYAFQHDHLVPWLSVLENIELVIPSAQKQELQPNINHWLNITQLADKKHILANRLSGGEQKRLNLIRSFILDPQLLLLDEPFAFQDSSFIQLLTTELNTYHTHKIGALILTAHTPSPLPFPYLSIHL